MIVKLMTEHHLEFLSLTGGCRGSSESTLVKMSNCWKCQAAAQFLHAILIAIGFAADCKALHFRCCCPPVPRFIEDLASVLMFY